MELDDYQRSAIGTAIYGAEHRLVYPALGLASEAGEVAGKVKKILRDRDGDLDQAPVEALADELGDVLWYVAVLARDLNLSLNAIAKRNLAKLASRQHRGRLGGDGDRR